MSLFLKASLACVFLLGANGCARGIPDEAPSLARVPAHWLSPSESEAPVDPNASPAASAAVDQVLDVHQGVLEGLSRGAPVEGTMAFLSEAMACVHPWHLAGYITDIAVTIQGIIGALTGSGTASAEAHWKPVGERSPPLKTQAAHLTVKEFASRLQLAAEIEPQVQAAVGSGVVRDASHLRAGVLEAATRFQAIARALGTLDLRGKSWDADNFRLEIQFDANGSPVPILNVGATVTFRFDWDKRRTDDHPALVARKLVSVAGAGDRLGHRVANFVSAVASDLNVLEANADLIGQRGFALSEVRIGVGLTAQGDFGVAQASEQVAGSFTFHPRALAPAEGAEAETALALDAGTMSLIGSGGDVRFRRNTFRKGLARASRLAAFFVQRAAAVRVGRWGIFELHTEFDLSPAGVFGMATVGGTGILELTYENQNI